MQLQTILKFLITCLAIVSVVIAAAAAWLFFAAPQQKGTPQTQQPATTTEQTPPPVVQQNPPVGQQPPPVMQQPPSPDDAQAQYATLFEAQGAKKILFATTTAGEIYALYAADVADAKKTGSSTISYPLMVAMLDLNADKAPEAIVYNDLPGYCGSGGCALDIWQKSNGTWQVIFEGLAYDTIGITDSTTSGYKNLLLSVHGDPGYMTKVMEYVFKDSTYQEWQLLAVWNGTAFAIPQ